jgi:hypothetical protein
MFLRGIDGAGVRGRTRTEDREATEDFSNGLIDRGRFWAGASPRRGATLLPGVRASFFFRGVTD